MTHWNASNFCKAALLAGVLVAAGCSRTENAKTGSADRAAADAAALQEREQFATRLEQRISDMERRVTDLKASADKRTKTNDRLDNIKETLKELREEVAEVRRPNLGTEWWPMTERYVERDVSRVGNGVRGPSAGSAARTDTTTPPAAGAARTDSAADLAERRDIFVKRMDAEIAQFERELENAPSKRPDIDLDGLRGEVKDLRDEVTELRNVTAANWWDATKKRLDRTTSRIERSIENLGKDKADPHR